MRRLNLFLCFLLKIKRATTQQMYLSILITSSKCLAISEEVLQPVIKCRGPSAQPDWLPGTGSSSESDLRRGGCAGIAACTEGRQRRRRAWRAVPAGPSPSARGPPASVLSPALPACESSGSARPPVRLRPAAARSPGHSHSGGSLCVLPRAAPRSGPRRRRLGVLALPGKPRC